MVYQPLTGAVTCELFYRLDARAYFGSDVGTSLVVTEDDRLRALLQVYPVGQSELPRKSCSPPTDLVLSLVSVRTTPEGVSSHVVHVHVHT